MGLCTITMVDGAKFDCKFINGKACGKGKYKPKKGKAIKGRWFDNKL